jgi:hypothetical protein
LRGRLSEVYTPPLPVGAIDPWPERSDATAKELGYQLVWRKAPAGQLRFVLAKQGNRRPEVDAGARVVNKWRSKSPLMP